MIHAFLNIFQTPYSKTKLTNLVLDYKTSKGNDPSFKVSAKKELSQLTFPRTDRISLRVSRKIISGSFIAERYSLIIPHCVYISDKGPHINIAFAKGLENVNYCSFIAFPKQEDLAVFRHAAKNTCFYGGPGDLFHGSLGELNFRIEGNCLDVQYLQSSVNYADAIQHEYLDKKYKRAYSGWSTALIDQLFDHASTVDCTEILLPDNKIVGAIGDNKLIKIAEKYKFKLMERAVVTNIHTKKTETKIYFKKQTKT